MDEIVPFLVEDACFKGSYIAADTTIQEILNCHSYPEVVEQVLAQSVVLALALSQSIKYEGVFSLEVKGAGPISSLYVTVTHDKQVRAYCNFDEEKIRLVENPTNETLFGNGQLLFSVSQIGQEPYQGVVMLKGETLVDTVLDYFLLSEQIKTSIMVRVKEKQARCIILQQMPLKSKDTKENMDDLFETLDILLKSAQDVELFSPKLPSEQLLYRLFHANDLVVFEKQTPVFFCPCHSQKMKRFLDRLDPQERDTLYKDGQIVVECQFCQKQYVFLPEDFK